MSGMKLIYKKIPAIMAEVGHIEKSRKGESLNYKFRGIDDIYMALQPLFAKHGVFVVPKVLNITREERATKSGGILTFSILTVEYTFFAEDGSSVTAIAVGEAMDTSDKSSNKAMSAALKYVALQTFCIPTEEEKDTEYQNHEPAPRGELPKPLSIVTPSDVGSYVVKCGKKWMGTRLDKIGPHDCDEYSRYLRESAELKKQALIGDYLECAVMMEKFVASREVKQGGAK